MDRHGILAVLVLFLMVADVSNASLLSKLRMLAAVVPKKSSGAIQVSPSPSPDPVRVDVKAPNKTSSVDPKPDSKGLNKKNNNITGTVVGPPAQNQTDSEKNQEPKKKDEIKPKTDSIPKPKAEEEEEVVGENCTAVARRCTDRNSMVACILRFETGSKELVILVQNEGEDILKVDVSASSPIDNSLVEIHKHRSKKINLAVGENREVKLNAGNGECVLHLDPPVSQGNFFLHLPSYDQLVTPINGAYFLILTVIMFGGTWACCMVRKKRQQGAIPYQELEMGLPESGSANNVESAEGWDQGWDDDWDEENAVKSPATNHAGSISANGLTSRSSNKEGWENDWDD